MRIEQQLTPEFSKNKEFETYLSMLNNSLYEAEQPLYKNYKEQYPTIHVLGAPRSGTTLVTQLLSSFLDTGYINNLIAAFWKAPLFGIQLSKKLLGTQYVSDFSSSFGRTSNINEPHEFGYFWNYHLSYNDFQQRGKEHEQHINWERLKTVLTNITHAFDKPVLFKSFLMGFHARHLHNILPKTCFIYVHRGFIPNALSIYRLRQKMLGDIALWASVKPKQYDWLKHEDVYHQIAGQILFLEYEYLQQLKEIPESNKRFFSYEQVCKAPYNCIVEVATMVMQQETDCSISKKIINSFNTNETVPEADAAHVERFMEAYSKIKNKHSFLNTV